MSIGYGKTEIIFLWSLGTDFGEFQKCIMEALLRQGHLSEEETAVRVTSDTEGSLKQRLLHIPDEACIQSGLPDHFLAA